MAREDERLAEMMSEATEPTLLGQMIGLRSDLRERRTRELVWRGVLAVGVVVALLLYLGQRHATDSIIAARKESRIATCQVLDDMRAKHNDLVNTAIAERQAIVDQTAASNASDAQKAANQAFFGQQIDHYRSDLLTIVNCDDPAAVASLFTRTP